MRNEEYRVLTEEADMPDEELTDEELTDEDDMTDEELTDEDDLTDEEMIDEELTLITEIQIALFGFLFGMAIMGLLVYATTPTFRFFI